MRVRAALIASLVAMLGALAWGWQVDREPVPARPADLTVPLTDAWQAALPLEPAAATRAYLERIPSAMRERGEAYSDTRMAAFVLRVLTLVRCRTGYRARANTRPTCIRSERPRSPKGWPNS